MTMTNLESGRSMVEMLGVLAVIGVLSIGGIAGYNYAMNKHRANQVLQDIRLLYQETKYPNTVRQILNGHFPDIEIDFQSPYEYDLDFPNLEDFNYDSKIEKTPNLISVNVLGVSKGTCDVLLKTKPEYVLMLKANGESTWNCTQDENELSYIFEITTDKLEYGKCTVCTGNHCFDDDLNCPEGEYCQNDVCSKCARGYTENTSGQCTSCSFNRNLNLTQENCHRCGDMMYGSDPNAGGDTNCYPCSHVNINHTTKEYCQKCMDVNSDVMYLNGACINCKNRFIFRTGISKDNCSACGEINGNGQFAWYSHFHNLCVNCESIGATANSEHTECICPDNKVWVWGYNYSGCYTCTGKIENTNTSKTECDKCANRYYATTNNEKTGECKLCPEGQTKSADGKSCVDKPAS